jgi:hypothetical protein
MKNSKLAVAVALMLFSAVNVAAQKKKPAAPSRPGPIEMPADAEVKVMPGDEQFENKLSSLEKFVTFKFDEKHKNADVYITENGKQKLVYKAKLDETGVDTKLKAGIDNRKVYSLDGKTLLFTYETEPSATSLIKMIYNSPEKKFTIFDFSKLYGSNEYTMGKTETFKYFPVFLYYSTFDAPRQ